jgi:hypothetical protein
MPLQAKYLFVCSLQTLQEATVSHANNCLCQPTLLKAPASSPNASHLTSPHRRDHRAVSEEGTRQLLNSINLEQAIPNQRDSLALL